MPRRTVMPSKRALNVLVTMVVLGSAHTILADSPNGNPEAGRKIYLESCLSCHGQTGKGDSEMAAYLSPPPADLAAKSTQSKTEAQLRKIIFEGRQGTAMTGYVGAFEEAQLTDLLAYIRSLKP